MSNKYSRESLAAELAAIEKERALIARKKEQHLSKIKSSKEETSLPLLKEEEGWEDYAKRKAIRTGRAVATGLADSPSAIVNLPSTVGNLGIAGYDWWNNTQTKPFKDVMPYWGSEYVKPAIDKATNYKYLPRNEAEKATEKGVEFVSSLPGIGHIAKGVKAASMLAGAGKAAKIGKKAASLIGSGTKLNKQNIMTAFGAGSASELGHDIGGTPGALIGGFAGGLGGSGASKIIQRHPIKRAIRKRFGFNDSLYDAYTKESSLTPSLASVGNEEAQVLEAALSQHDNTAQKMRDFENKRVDKFLTESELSPERSWATHPLDELGGKANAARKKRIETEKANYAKRQDETLYEAARRGVKGVPISELEKVHENVLKETMGRKPNKLDIAFFNKEVPVIKDVVKTPLLPRHQGSIQAFHGKERIIPWGENRRVFQNLKNKVSGVLETQRDKLPTNTSRILKKFESSFPELAEKYLPEDLRASYQAMNKDYSEFMKTLKKPTHSWEKLGTDKAIGTDLLKKIHKNEIQVEQLMKDMPMGERKSFFKDLFQSYLYSEGSKTLDIRASSPKISSISREGKENLKKSYRLLNPSPSAASKFDKALELMDNEARIASKRNFSNTTPHKAVIDKFSSLAKIMSSKNVVSNVVQAVTKPLIEAYTASRITDPKFLEGLRYAGKVQNPSQVPILIRKMREAGVSEKYLKPLHAISDSVKNTDQSKLTARKATLLAKKHEEN